MDKTMSLRSSRIRKLTVAAMFAAIATILAYVEFPLPFMPPFLKFDLSGVPVLIAAFMMGPVTAVIITFIKNLIHFFSSQSGGVGQLADFIILSCFSLTASLVYLRKKDKKHALLGCLAATAIIPVVGIIPNKFLLIPFYSQFMPMDAIISACEAINPNINTIDAYYLYGVVPFNLIKGIILSVITVLCYKKLSVLIKGTHELSL